MSTVEGEGAPSDAELSQLRADIAEVKASLAALAKASTPAQKADARDDVDEAEADLARTARKLGLPVERYKAAVAAARRQAFDDEYGAAIDARVDAALERLLAEGEEEAGDAGSGDAGKPAHAGKKAKPAKPKDDPDAAGGETPPPDDDDKPDDTDPVVPHWSEKPLRELIR